MAILVTGGAGFIGSHTCVEMLNAGYEVIVVDNLCNASEEAIRRVEKITGKNVTFYKADIRDKEALDQIFDKESVECVIHFAGLKAVGESVAKPLEYYQNNIAGTLTLCDVMRNHNVKNIMAPAYLWKRIRKKKMIIRQLPHRMELPAMYRATACRGRKRRLGNLTKSRNLLPS